jgi:iron-sulfur cluster assembly accessory protein
MMQEEAAQVTSEAPISLTPTAVEQVKLAMKREGAASHGLRVAVRSGGCSGLEYHLAFEDAPNEGDTVVHVDGVAVFIDPTSQEHLAGVTIDYVSGLHGAGFKFLNPNAARTCGCGSSFST